MKAREQEIIELSNKLFAAISAKKITDMQTLITQGADLARTKAGKTPIQYAHRLGFVGGIHAILEAVPKTTPNDTYKYGDVLLFATEYNDTSMALKLITAGAALDWHTVPNLNSCLHWTVKKENLTLLRELLLYGANLASLNAEGETPAELAAKNNWWEGLEEIVATVKKPLIIDKYKLGAALLYAVKDNCKVALIESLLDAGASLAWSSTASHYGYLHWAVSNKNTDVFNLLLNKGAKQFHGKDKITVFDLACSQGKWEYADILIQHKTFETSNHTHTALLHAITAGQMVIANKLLDKGISINHIFNGNTYLHCAVEQWNTLCKPSATLLFLLEHGASQVAINSAGETPIELACKLKLWNCAQVLIMNNAKNQDNSLIKTNSALSRIAALHYEDALFYAIQAANYFIANLLLEQGTPCDSSNSDYGNISLYYAIKLNDNSAEAALQIISLLLKYGANPNIKNKNAKNTYDLAQELHHAGSFLQSILQALKPYINTENTNPTAALTITNKSAIKINTILNIKHYREAAQVMNQGICSNTYAAKDLPIIVKRLSHYYDTILEYDAAILKEQCDQKKLPSSTTMLLTQTTDTTSELGKLYQLNGIINTLLNFPQKSITLSLDTLQNFKMIEADDAANYICFKRQAAQYHHNVKQYLYNLATQISTKKDWKKYFLGMWVRSKPDHIIAIEQQINKLLINSSFEETLTIYADVLRLLFTTSAYRHKDTSAFDHIYITQACALSFVDLPCATTYTAPLQSTTYPYQQNYSLPDEQIYLPTTPMSWSGYPTLVYGTNPQQPNSYQPVLLAPTPNYNILHTYPNNLTPVLPTQEELTYRHVTFTAEAPTLASLPVNTPSQNVVSTVSVMPHYARSQAGVFVAQQQNNSTFPTADNTPLNQAGM